MLRIVLEGVDGVGKSTLAKQILDELPHAQSVHHGVPTKNIFDMYVTDFEIPERISQSLVIDRMFWSTHVYKSGLSTAGWRWLNLYWQARGLGCWLIDHPLETILERLETRGEDLIPLSQIADLRESFYSAEQDSSVSCGRVTPDQDSVKQIVAKALEIEKATKDLRFYTNYIGGPSPNVLFVGERKIPNGGITDAAMCPSYSSTANFFLESLPESQWHTFAVCDEFNTDVKGLIDTVQPKKIIALGTNVNDKLTKQGIESRLAVAPIDCYQIKDNQTMYREHLQEVIYA